MNEEPCGLMVSIFDRSGIMAEPWAENGYRTICVDIAQTAPGLRNGIEFISADVFEWALPACADFVAAFPPCDHLAASGARWFREKGDKAFSDAMRLVRKAVEICDTLTDCWMLENPIGRLSTYWRRPDYIFDPCDFVDYVFGDFAEKEAYSKKTCLWTGPAFKFPEKRGRPAKLGSVMHVMPQTPDRKYKRSLTPRGFAWAVYQANAQGFEM